MIIVPEQSLRAKEERIKAGLRKAFDRSEEAGMAEMSRALRDTERPDEFLTRAEKQGIKFDDKDGESGKQLASRGKVYAGWTPPRKRSG